MSVDAKERQESKTPCASVHHGVGTSDLLEKYRRPEKPGTYAAYRRSDGTYLGYCSSDATALCDAMQEYPRFGRTGDWYVKKVPQVAENPEKRGVFSTFLRRLLK